MIIEFEKKKLVSAPVVFTEGNVYMLKDASTFNNSIFLCAKTKEGKRLISLHSGNIWNSSSCSGCAGDVAFEDITDRVKLVDNK